MHHRSNGLILCKYGIPILNKDPDERWISNACNPMGFFLMNCTNEENQSDMSLSILLAKYPCYATDKENI
jgi:hypothetical protein